jgi:hypothetical protein
MHLPSDSLVSPIIGYGASIWGYKMYLVLTLYITEPVDFSWGLANIHQTRQSPEIWDGYLFFINNGNALYVYGVDLII